MDERRPELPVVVGVDGSPESWAALAWGGRQSLARHSWLQIATAWPIDGRHGAAEVDDEPAARALLATAETVAGTAVRRWVPPLPGPARELLLRRSRHAQLLVLGRHAHHSLSEHLLGSTTEHVLGHATCPVAVVRRDPGPSRGRIVVGIDASATSRAALQWAVGQALVTGQPVHAVLVWTWQPDFGYPSGPTEREAERSAQAAHDGQLATLPPEHRSLVGGGIVRGDVDERLLAEVRDDDVLVVGSRGEGRLAGFVLGSVSRAAVARATAPVVVVPGPVRT